MQIRIIGEHLDLSPSFKDYLKHKVNQSNLPEEMQEIEFRMENYGKSQKHLKFVTTLNRRDVIIDVTADTVYQAADKTMKVFNDLLAVRGKKNIKKQNYIIKDFKH